MVLRLKNLAVTSLLAGSVHAHVMVGQTFPIAEPDTLTEIQERAAKADWNTWRQNAGAKSKAFFSVTLPLAQADADRLFDPTYTLTRDIADATGKVLFAKGTRVNVYRRIKDPRRYIVIADQESHYQWLKDVAKPKDDDLVLLANGNVYEARMRTKLELYLLDDRFVERFGLQHVPSVVQQEGTMLRIHEYAVR
jgi:conjugal transfer pilus assembly protein TraW